MLSDNVPDLISDRDCYCYFFAQVMELQFSNMLQFSSNFFAATLSLLNQVVFIFFLKCDRFCQDYVIAIEHRFITKNKGVCLFVVPSLSSYHEKATAALYFGRIRIRLGVFQLFF